MQGIKKKLGIFLAAFLLAIAGIFAMPKPSYALTEGIMAAGNDRKECTSILPHEWCPYEDESQNDGSAIFEIIKAVIKILSGGVLILATLGIMICGFLWATARDNEAQVKMAKNRIFDIVIGLLIWALIAFAGDGLLNYLSPNGKEAKDELDISVVIEGVYE